MGAIHIKLCMSKALFLTSNTSITPGPPYLNGEYICCVTSVHSCKLLVSEWIPDDGMLIIRA